ncbi:MAG: DUF4402 domain-containing protein [Acidobacteriota bacterium]
MTRRLPLRAAILLGALAMGVPSAARAQVCNATNDPSLAIARTADLQFGDLGATPSAGTAVIDAATGGRTVTGGVVAAGALFNAGAFDVLLCGPAGPKRFDVILPAGSVTLAGPGGATMTVDTFTASPKTSNVSGSTSSVTTITVGGTLRVGANQAPGAYTGTFTVIVARQ